MRLILLGGPGAGKGTQADLICAAQSIPKISTGDMLRAAVNADSALGRKAKQVMEAGELVTDDIILGLIEERIQQPDCKRGFLFDGFPRTIPQAEGLQGLRVCVDRVIEINVDDEEIVRRLSGRRVHAGSGRTYHIDFNPPHAPGRDDQTGEALVQREDDQEETIRNRLRVYHQQTEPLIQFYQIKAEQNENGVERFSRVDGQGSVNEIKARIFALLD